MSFRRGFPLFALLADCPRDCVARDIDRQTGFETAFTSGFAFPPAPGLSLPFASTPFPYRISCRIGTPSGFRDRLDRGRSRFKMDTADYRIVLSNWIRIAFLLLFALFSLSLSLSNNSLPANIKQNDRLNTSKHELKEYIPSRIKYI